MCLFNAGVGSQGKCAYRVRSNRLCGGSCFGLAASDDSNSFLRMWLPAPFKRVWMDGWRVQTEKTKAVNLKAEAKASKWLVYFRIKTGTYSVTYIHLLSHYQIN